jgi:hypothetical protein
MSKVKPTVICICGSGKFWQEIQRQRRKLTLEGKIVLGPEVQADGSRDADADGSDAKPALDELHFRKIDIAQEVLVVDYDTVIPGSKPYTGPSTEKEIQYAKEASRERGLKMIRLSEMSMQ